MMCTHSRIETERQKIERETDTDAYTVIVVYEERNSFQVQIE